MKATIAPWRFVDGRHSDRNLVNADDQIIVSFYWPKPSDPRRKAIEALIEQAPAIKAQRDELLAAIKGYREAEQAEGMTLPSHYPKSQSKEYRANLRAAVIRLNVAIAKAEGGPT